MRDANLAACNGANTSDTGRAIHQASASRAAAATRGAQVRLLAHLHVKELICDTPRESVMISYAIMGRKRLVTNPAPEELRSVDYRSGCALRYVATGVYSSQAATLIRLRRRRNISIRTAIERGVSGIENATEIDTGTSIVNGATTGERCACQFSCVSVHMQRTRLVS